MTKNNICVYKVDGEYYCKYPSEKERENCMCLGNTDSCPYLIKGAAPLHEETLRVLDTFWKPFIDNCNQHFS